MSLSLTRIYLKSIGVKINRLDIRSIRAWCKKNYLTIYKDSSGEFVYSNDFELSYDRPLILGLKSKYGNAWLDYYQAYKKDELFVLLGFTNETRSEKSNYIPKGEITSRRLKK
jgi:hypothetical protein